MNMRADRSVNVRLFTRGYVLGVDLARFAVKQAERDLFAVRPASVNLLRAFLGGHVAGLAT
jgi:hypothetical protein